MALTQDYDTDGRPAGGLLDVINDELDTDTAAGDETSPAANVTLTDDDEVIDGEVTLPGMYADCEVDDGRRFTVRITNRERVEYERTARRREWGPATDSPHYALTFMAHAAARRAGDPAGSLTFDQFIERVVEVEGREVKRARPTR